MSTEATNWALSRAPLPKCDPAAQLVLVRLAWRADKHGRGADLTALEIAHDLNGMDTDVVGRVLKRLVQYDLISKSGTGASGQVVWQLHMNVVKASNSFHVFAKRSRQKKAEKRARVRKTHAANVTDDESATGSGVTDDEQVTVTDDESATPADVTDDESVVSPTMSRSVTDDESDGLTKPPTGRNNYTTQHACEAHDEPDADSSDGLWPAEETATEPHDPDYLAEFEEFWRRYQTAKRTGSRGIGTRKEALDKWNLAVKKATPQEILDGLDRYLASSDPQRGYPMHARKWLLHGLWTEEWELYQPLRAVSGDGPYRNPSPADYHSEF